MKILDVLNQVYKKLAIVNDPEMLSQLINYVHSISMKEKIKLSPTELIDLETFTMVSVNFHKLNIKI